MRKCLQITYAKIDYYLEYIKNVQNLTVKKQTLQSESGKQYEE